MYKLLYRSVEVKRGSLREVLLYLWEQEDKLSHSLVHKGITIPAPTTIWRSQ